MPMAAGTPTRPDRAILRREATWGATAAVVALAVAAWSLRLWAWDPANPIDLGYDNTQIPMAAQDDPRPRLVLDTTPTSASRSGAGRSPGSPSSTSSTSTHQGLDLSLPGAFTAGSVYFVLSFPLTAVTMYLLARSQGLGRPAGLLTGVLLANAPGHSERFGHLYLAQYWVVPVALWLVLEVLRGRALLSRDAEGRTRWRGARTLTAVAAVVVVGFSGVYYVAFTLVLLAVAARRSPHRRQPRRPLPGPRGDARDRGLHRPAARGGPARDARGSWSPASSRPSATRPSPSSTPASSWTSCCPGHTTGSRPWSS